MKPEARTAPVVIVSGLPRSGTSMMMKMLEAGGMPVLADHVRQADEDNPRGYYEFEPVKKTKEDPSWLAGAGGKAVKMVSMLLYHLPSDYEYRIVFMRRDIDEILASQKAMLVRSGKGAEGQPSDEAMKRKFDDHLDKIGAWFGGQAHMSVLYVGYNDLLRNPSCYVDEINAFLGDGLDTAKMSQVIDPSLYRQRFS